MSSGAMESVEKFAGNALSGVGPRGWNRQTAAPPSARSRRDAVLLAVERCYDFPEFGGYLGNVGWEGEEHILAKSWICPIPRDHV